METIAELEAAVAFAEQEREAAYEAWRRSRWPERDALFAADMRLLDARFNLEGTIRQLARTSDIERRARS
ncbi:hypothetical protein LG322_08710 [Microbacterium aerolatum]|uniref:hypothetical protein n=1 Tax=Microbacterium aerolatum TaxID=153731 RepID=UPI00384CA3B8